jgi:hypothetical protein
MTKRAILTVYTIETGAGTPTVSGRTRTRRKTSEWTVPKTGVRDPQRTRWTAILDLEPGEYKCAIWLLCHLERNQPLGRRALARECHVSSNTAVKFLNSAWVDWARSCLGLENTSNRQQDEHAQLVEEVLKRVRMTLDYAVLSDQPAPTVRLVCQ